jgi:hypothetical protein
MKNSLAQMKIAFLLVLSVFGHVRSENDQRDGVEAVIPQPKKSYLRGDQSVRELGVYSARVMVHYANDKGREEALAQSSRLYHDFHEDRVLSIEIGESNIAELADSPNVISIEEDRIYTEQGFHERTLSEEEYEQRRLQQKRPYGVTMVQADQLKVGPNPVRVCIADTGAAFRHPDLPRWLMNGADRDSSITGSRLYWKIDARGHGSHIAGTISAKDNSIGVRGIGKIPLYITRALDDNGGARESDVYSAIAQCTYSGAKVISMSLGGSGMSQNFKDLLTNLYDNHGFLLIGASGNDGVNSVAWPAAHPRVIAVGAVQEDKTIWSGSNYGSEVELSAPGKSILSTTINSSGQFIYRYVPIAFVFYMVGLPVSLTASLRFFQFLYRN